jgi:serine/threonine protein kinase
MKQILSSIKILHELGIAHRDIKQSNILLDKNDKLYIADYGLAAINTQNMSDDELIRYQRIVGTKGYLAPEGGLKLSGNYFTLDMWAVGIIFLELMLGNNSSIAV